MNINFAQSKVTVRALFGKNKFSKRMLGPINPTSILVTEMSDKSPREVIENDLYDLFRPLETHSD